MNNRLKCKLFCSSASGNLYQVYAGFAELEHDGLIDMEITHSPHYSSWIYGHRILLVEINNNFRVIYDTMDQPWIDPAWVNQSIDLKNVDYYFKSSYKPECIENIDKRRVFPLGLTYVVFSKHDFFLRRAFWSNNLRDFFSQLIRSNRLLSKKFDVMISRYTSDISCYEQIPAIHENPKVIFMTRLWDPKRAKTSQLREEREKINEMRAGCIRKLRKEFGDQFIGGVEHSDFSTNYFSDCLVPDPKLSRKPIYLQLMHDSDICITTVGGQGANAGKLGEYVAASKAIVAEQLQCGLPGKFQIDENYLDFETPDECVDRVSQLLKNKKKMWNMMGHNWRYYHQYVHPKSLIWNSLMTVITDEQSLHDNSVQ
jgi:hypothetical protein